MAGKYESQSLKGVNRNASTAVIGSPIFVARGGRGVKEVAFQAAVSGTTANFSVRVQVSINGITYANIGSAATTLGSSQAGTITKSTSAVAFSHARLVLTAGATAAANKVSGWIVGG